ncbi:indolepyruvate ferredoxin oxidoreductase alpha subunit [Mariniphaga anaerophila]|uniref:Indolepyruvate oxidoreductase subunit IorA n=1 Tax=Mariniphaga anaerophila TaxID=1484053 RepID=A0A1M5GCK3_9BACT|nr:thiamine pyrophosphate-dependent enzyme [Mariniphaga anaerophila]SHG01231.1 indolepyruvate ferredoxin oxidoreductase alpha subunit [Mariniphaga anaerophila]
MQRNLLLGVEAIGQAAVDAGISGVYAYPGTPSTEITEYIQHNQTARERNIHREWSVNEKTALEAALGMSYAGKRTIACMKHVGLNVAADVLMNMAITGINGGLVITVADDPSQHSSQNEQDSRYYGKFAMIPVFEPSSQQEAYDMTYDAFEFSEKTGLPVMMRIPTRLAHSRAGVVQKTVQEENKLKLPENKNQFILLPAYGRKYYQSLLDKQSWLTELSEKSVYNEYFEGKDKSLGIICCGITYNYLMENYPHNNCHYPVVKITQYPVPKSMLTKLEKECDELLVVEEGYPVVEELLTDFFGKGTKVSGRLDGTLPRRGELNPDHLAKALGKEQENTIAIPDTLVGRPPSLCAGCGHQDTYIALNEIIAEAGAGRVFADIGCYTLGALPPFNTVNTCVDMGASITMAKGAADAGLSPVFAVIGDSTFTHSGITGLLDCVIEKTNINIIIVDNETVAMTGGQDSSAKGRIEKICEGVGVNPEHVRLFVPLKKNHEEIVNIIREEVAFNGVSVIIGRRECVQRIAKMKKLNKAKKQA